jgi:23S rRNA (adenine-N6)-dimethyltransferase
VTADDVVVEIGAGTGRITEPLARRARRVIAVELDPQLARALRRSVGRNPVVDVVERDVLELRMPVEPFRAFGNLPFALSTRILRALFDDPGSALTRADVLVQYEAALKRASAWPSRLATLGWAPWWEFAVVRRVPARAFEPPPPVDAGMLRVTRRVPALLSIRHAPAYRRLLTAAFRRSAMPIRRSLRDSLPPLAWKRLARERGLPPDATPPQLDVFDWLDVFMATPGERGLA